MPRLNQLKLQRNLFVKHPRKPVTDVHAIIYSHDSYIKHLSHTGYDTRTIANKLHIPYQKLRQYMKYHHIGFKPKHVYYQDHMENILPYVKRYKRLSIVARMLNLSYSALYKAYTDYKQKPSNHTPVSKSTPLHLSARLKAKHVEMKQLKHQRDYYKNKYQNVSDKYNQLTHLVNQYLD